MVATTKKPTTTPVSPRPKSPTPESDEEELPPLPLDSPAGRRLAKLPISLAPSDPRAVHWAPFDVDAARNFHNLNHIAVEPSIPAQVELAKAFLPVLQSYRERSDIPDEVELFLWSSSRLLKGIFEAVKKNPPSEVREAYRVARPALKFRDNYDHRDPNVEIIPRSFILPKIAKPVVRALPSADSDVEAEPEGTVSVVEPEEPPTKKRKVEVLLTPHSMLPAPSAPAAPVLTITAPPAPIISAPTSLAPVLSVSNHNEFTKIAFSLPREDAPSPALMRIPSHYVQDSLNPSLYNPSAFPCVECASHFRTCPGADESSGRATSCLHCINTHKSCSLNWTPASFVKLTESLRPYQNLSPQTIASFMQKLYQATVDSEFSAVLHARALSTQRLAAQDLMTVIRNVDNALVESAFQSLFEDPADVARLRGMVDAFFERESEIHASSTFVAEHPTSAVIPPPAGSSVETPGTCHPEFSNRIPSRPNFGPVDASLLPGSLSGPLARLPAPPSITTPMSRSCNI
ncbi:hypothetical protein R3P38DRAFT_3220378 [Favolaschia claudopus]|uniref:Uncharacterized protein n=1 Tax=Favolaschia claudopus TaxID=2862362 RepID=A0AAW0A1D4_9AGAR